MNTPIHANGHKPPPIIITTVIVTVPASDIAALKTLADERGAVLASGS